MQTLFLAERRRFFSSLRILNYAKSWNSNVGHGYMQALHLPKRLGAYLFEMLTAVLQKSAGLISLNFINTYMSRPSTVASRRYINRW